ncbi:unnamed protein product, partial [marine sediment metagenome]
PHKKAIAKLRAAMYENLTPASIAKVIRMMIKKAEKGNLSAAKELLDRSIGRPRQDIDVNTAGATPLVLVLKNAIPPAEKSDKGGND